MFTRYLAYAIRCVTPMIAAYRVLGLFNTVKRQLPAERDVLLEKLCNVTVLCCLLPAKVNKLETIWIKLTRKLLACWKSS